MVTHIVRNYERLASRTVFLHGRLASCGFFTASGANGGHLITNVSALDYTTHPFFSESKGAASRTRPPAVFMPLTARFDANLTMLSLRSSFADLSQNVSAPKQRVPHPVSPHPTGDDGDHWLPWEKMGFGQYIARQYRGPQGTVPYTLRSFFQAVFGRAPP